MTKEETVERLCALCTEVNERKFNHGIYSDCFCKGSIMPDKYFEMDEKIIIYIEKTVRDSILKDAERAYTYGSTTKKVKESIERNLEIILTALQEYLKMEAKDE